MKDRLNTAESINYLKSLGDNAKRFLDGNKEGIESPESICDIRHIVANAVENHQQYRLKYNEVKLGDTVHRIALFKDGKYEPYFYEDEVAFLYWDKSVTDYTDYYKIPV